MNVSEQLLTQMKYLSKPGIFCFLNENNKIIDVRYSSNILLSIGRFKEEVNRKTIRPKTLLKDYLQGSIKIDVLEMFEDNTPRNKLLRQKYWMDHYTNLGYSHYRTSKSPVNYQLYTDIITISKQKRSTTYRLAVYLRTQKYDKILVGLFSHIDEMDQFINQYYPKNSPIYSIIYACSPETIDFFEQMNKKYYRIPKNRRYKYTNEFMKEYNRILIEEENKQG